MSGYKKEVGRKSGRLLYGFGTFYPGRNYNDDNNSN